MVETGYPVPSYLVDVFQNPEGVDRDPPSCSRRKGSHTFIRSMQLTMEWHAHSTNFSHSVITDSKGLTWVCFINFGTGRFYTINLTSQRTGSPTITPGNLANDLSFSHLTHFSGITATAHYPETTTLADVQTHLCKLKSRRGFACMNRSIQS